MVGDAGGVPGSTPTGWPDFWHVFAVRSSLPFAFMKPGFCLSDCGTGVLVSCVQQRFVEQTPSQLTGGRLLPVPSKPVSGNCCPLAAFPGGPFPGP